LLDRRASWGAGSEARNGTGYAKFGAVRPASRAEERFTRLLAALANDDSFNTVLAGVNASREYA